MSLSTLIPPEFAHMRMREHSAGQDWGRTNGGLYVPTSVVPELRRRTYDRPVGVSLFTGAGGFDLGFVQAGFHVAAAVEYDCDAVITYMVNMCRWGEVKIHFIEPADEERMEKALKPLKKEMSANKEKLLRADLLGIQTAQRIGLAGSGWISHQGPEIRGTDHVFIGDIRKLSGKRILDAIGLEVGEVSCVFGGPPCQGFSTMGKRQVMDPRNSLIFEMTRLIREIVPSTFVLENVPGLASMVTPEGIPVIDAIAMDLSKGGFGSYEALRKALSNDIVREKGARAGSRCKAETPEDGKIAKRKAPSSKKKEPNASEPTPQLFDSLSDDGIDANAWEEAEERAAARRSRTICEGVLH